MQITFIPQARRPGETLVLSRSDDVLTVNGTAYDFSIVGEGDVLDFGEGIAGDWFLADVTRAAGVLQITLALPAAGRLPPEFAPVITPGNGPIALPEIPA